MEVNLKIVLGTIFSRIVLVNVIARYSTGDRGPPVHQWMDGNALTDSLDCLTASCVTVS